MRWFKQEQGQDQNTTDVVWVSDGEAATGTNDDQPRCLKDFLIDLLGAASSFLVLVNIKTKDQRKSGNTFHLHLSYFILILIENVLLASSPLMLGNYSTHLDIAIALPFIILGLWILSCLLMVFFYKIYGHPWTDLNGLTQWNTFTTWVGAVKNCATCSCNTGANADDAYELPNRGSATTNSPQETDQVVSLLY